uniref:Uncharacterized protein n=1 Tax=Octopus bimaculoides TaxID=37653 RepID=A0A0L8FN85_OCTBM
MEQMGGKDEIEGKKQTRKLQYIGAKFWCSIVEQQTSLNCSRIICQTLVGFFYSYAVSR